MDDTRAYFYRYVTTSKRWCFFALDGTNMKRYEAALGSGESWVTKSGVVYEFCHVLFSYTRASRIIAAQINPSLSNTRMSRALGTAILQVLRDDAVICLVCVSTVVPNALEIHYEEKHLLVYETIPFEELKRVIQIALSIKPTATTVHTGMTHMII